MLNNIFCCVSEHHQYPCHHTFLSIILTVFIKYFKKIEIKSINGTSASKLKDYFVYNFSLVEFLKHFAIYFINFEKYQALCHITSFDMSTNSTD